MRSHSISMISYIGDRPPRGINERDYDDDKKHPIMVAQPQSVIAPSPQHKCDTILCNNKSWWQKDPCDNKLWKLVKMKPQENKDDKEDGKDGGYERYIPRSIFPQLILLPYLRRLYRQQWFVKQIEHWRYRPPPPKDHMNDIYDGAVWAELCQTRVLSHYCLAFSMNVDWFQPYTNVSHSTGGIYLAIENLPRRIRYVKSNLITLGVIPGPSQPDNLISVLTPSAEEIHLLHQNGALVDIYGVTGTPDKDGIIQGRSHIYASLIALKADLPASRAVAGFSGPTAIMGCARCNKKFISCGDKGKQRLYGRDRCVDHDEYHRMVDEHLKKKENNNNNNNNDSKRSAAPVVQPSSSSRPAKKRARQRSPSPPAAASSATPSARVTRSQAHRAHALAASVPSPMDERIDGVGDHEEKAAVIVHDTSDDSDASNDDASDDEAAIDGPEPCADEKKLRYHTDEEAKEYFSDHSTPIEFAARTDDNHRYHGLQWARQSSLKHRNAYVKKHGSIWSALFGITHYDTVRYTLVDPFHNLYLGTTKRFWTWLVSKKIIDKKQLEGLHRIIQQLIVPSHIRKVPRKIAIGKCFSSFSGEEWRVWLWISMWALSSPELDIEDDIIGIWELFVTACRLIGESRVKISDLPLVHALFAEFNWRAEKRFGSSFYTPNMHQHLHLVSMIRDYGPIQGWWGYGFERYNKVIGNMQHNGKSPEVTFMRYIVHGTFTAWKADALLSSYPSLPPLTATDTDLARDMKVQLYHGSKAAKRGDISRLPDAICIRTMIESQSRLLPSYRFPSGNEVLPWLAWCTAKRIELTEPQKRQLFDFYQFHKRAGAGERGTFSNHMYQMSSINIAGNIFTSTLHGRDAPRSYIYVDFAPKPPTTPVPSLPQRLDAMTAVVTTAYYIGQVEGYYHHNLMIDDGLDDANIKYESVEQYRKKRATPDELQRYKDGMMKRQQHVFAYVRWFKDRVEPAPGFIEHYIEAKDAFGEYGSGANGYAYSQWLPIAAIAGHCAIYRHGGKITAIPIPIRLSY